MMRAPPGRFDDSSNVQECNAWRLLCRAVQSGIHQVPGRLSVGALDEGQGCKSPRRLLHYTSRLLSL